MDKITVKKLEKYFKVTEKTLKKVKIKKGKNKQAKELLNLAQCYYEDARYFKKKKDLVNAFAAINYAHAFLDAGARLKIFNIKDKKLLMVD